MSRARAFVGGGSIKASSINWKGKPSKHRQREVVRQQLRKRIEQLEQPKLTVAERVLPWRRRRKAKEREQALQRLGHVEDTHAQIASFRGRHRRLWKGIHTVSERRILDRIGKRRYEQLQALGEDAPVYDHPQRRRMEREMRIAARQAAEDERYGVAA